VTDTALEVDGRRLRREQNREAVIDALIELFGEGLYQPSSAEIAERASISPRSLFRYFDDVDDLNRAAVERHLNTHRALFEIDIDPEAPTETKIEQFVDARVHLHETVAPAARAARLVAHRREVIDAQLYDTRRFMRTQVHSTFARELDGERAALLPAVDELCSFEAYEFMRNGHRMSRAKATAALTAALTQLLNTERGTS
jgi:TetR/AcrR family transcriptional regulator of autoinduction and epiphytic fitness